MRPRAYGDDVRQLVPYQAEAENGVAAGYGAWHSKQANQRIAIGIVIALIAACFAGCSKTPATPSALKASASQCLRNQDFACAQKDLQAYIRLRPDDALAIARLGIADNKLDQNAATVAQFKKAIDLGEGTYDLFSYYADSLAKLGQTDAAIDWNYKALAVVPSLVDVRGRLAKLLVKKKRYFEALILLASFDDHLKSIGYPPYFTAQRIAIESAMQQSNAATSAEQSQLRLPETFGNFYAPVILGQSHVTAFVVDTGATLTTVNDDFLRDSKAKYEVLRASVRLRTANGQRVRARLLNINAMQVGAFNLKDVAAVECPDCQLLLGQDTLSRFDLASRKVQGVEFLTLRPRKL